MSEAVEHILFRELPLDAVHRRHGASMSEQDGWLLPGSYAGLEAEYEAVRGGAAGLMDLSARGRISVSGAEAVMFLNGLITNDVKALSPGRCMHAAFPNAQGRLLAFVRVINRGDSFLIDTEAATHAQVLKLLERFTLAGDFRVEDLSGQALMLSVQGARAAEAVAALLGQNSVPSEPFGVTQTERHDGPLMVIRATHTGEDGCDLLVGAEQAEELWEALVREGGAVPCGYEAQEVLRIEAGRPRFAVDVDETNVVLEAGQDEAVSFTKGCYIGQEIIARIHWRGHVAKRLTGLIFEQEDESEPHWQRAREARIKSSDGREIGRITSITRSPQLRRTIALGIVKYDYLSPGTPVLVTLGEDDERAAQVAELPFVRGSWPGVEKAGEGQGES